MPATVAVVDRHPLVLDAVANLLEEHGFEVVSRTTSGTEALEEVAQRRPGVLVIDPDVPDADGLDLLRNIRKLDPEISVVVLSEPGRKTDIADALRTGAVVYVLKSSDPDDVVTAVRQALSQSVFLPTATEATIEEPVPHKELTPRELEILRLVAQGSSNAAVARQLWVTEQTVKFHLSNIYRKLGVSNRTEASRYAGLHGLIGDESTGRRAS
jgi:DNA-binding NarL/FixJ family response regulator